MSFKMENFKMGVNENGIHFQDSETGVLFTLIKADYDRLNLAICSASADKDVCDSLKVMILRNLSKQGLEKCDFEDIPQEKCYISENQDIFVLKDFAGDGISILHKQTNKAIGLIEVIDGVPVIGFDLESNYGYEEAVKDFFELCCNNIQEIKAGTYHGKTQIKREDAFKDIKQKLLKCLVEGVKNTCLSKSSTETEYEVTEKRIIVKMDEISQIKMKNMGNSWIVDERETTYPIRGLVYTIEAMRRFPQINRVTYRYTFENSPYDVNITPKNINKVLKEAVKRKIIDLTV